ncbi:MAG TPA: bifunctional UDP-N-acetylglucosamine diphosphorylase/glucosamine-1-phosphate N-acetyltransferase GlmU [Stellaceae bacterium]|nr:bifunctional UDP-N-acetylglucosamine diphosphorylase/glucosamine-1-phosphate N-acetyltransferase GlmU [Stellaceae bacterium]
MEPRPFAAVILAAGQGSRMKSGLPKVLHPVAQFPMIDHVLAALRSLGAKRTVVVVAPGMEQRMKRPDGVTYAVQPEPRGTGDAVAAAAPALQGFDGDLLVLYGDTPLITPGTIATLLAAKSSADIVVAGMRLAEPAGYGRLVAAADGTLDAIVEARDCDAAQRAITFLNAGPIVGAAARLFALLGGIGRHNAQQEYYLTDIVAAARQHGLACRAIEVPADEMAGVNDRAELAAIEALMQRRLRAAMMQAGVSLLAPETVFFAADTRIGQDSSVGPYVMFGPGVTIGRNVEILGFSHIAGARIGDQARIGPFARLRPGADLGEHVHVGNFVEVKNARLDAGAKANHLAYLGDAHIGARSNIGAGTITCNYDGVDKHRTEIGADVFVGTNSSLVAPITIADGAIIAAGSTITDNVPADALALGRGWQVTKPGRAADWRKQHTKKKDRAG